MTPSGQPVLKLRLACSESYLDRNNARQERTEFVRITMWGKRGDSLGKILKKGDRIFVEGRLQTSSYEKNGEKRYSTEVVATNVLLSGKGGGGNGSARSSTIDGPGDDAFDPPAETSGSSGTEPDIPF